MRGRCGKGQEPGRWLPLLPVRVSMPALLGGGMRIRCNGGVTGTGKVAVEISGVYRLPGTG